MFFTKHNEPCSSTPEIPSNEKLEHRNVLWNEGEKEPLHTLLVVMRVI